MWLDCVVLSLPASWLVKGTSVRDCHQLEAPPSSYDLSYLSKLVTKTHAPGREFRQLRRSVPGRSNRYATDGSRHSADLRAEAGWAGEAHFGLKHRDVVMGVPPGKKPHGGNGDELDAAVAPGHATPTTAICPMFMKATDCSGAIRRLAKRPSTR